MSGGGMQIGGNVGRAVSTSAAEHQASEKRIQSTAEWLDGLSASAVLESLEDVLRQLKFDVQGPNQLSSALVLRPRLSESFAAYVEEVGRVCADPPNMQPAGRFDVRGNHSDEGRKSWTVLVRYIPDPNNQQLQQAVAIMKIAAELLEGERATITRGLDAQGYPILTVEHADTPPVWTSVLGSAAANDAFQCGSTLPYLLMLQSGEIRRLEDGDQLEKEFPFTAVQALAARVRDVESSESVYSGFRDGNKIIGCLQMQHVPSAPPYRRTEGELPKKIIFSICFADPRDGRLFVARRAGLMASRSGFVGPGAHFTDWP